MDQNIVIDSATDFLTFFYYYTYQEFPPTSKLDPKVYGNQTSSITREHIEKTMNGLTVNKVNVLNQLFSIGSSKYVDLHHLINLGNKQQHITLSKSELLAF